MKGNKMPPTLHQTVAGRRWTMPENVNVDKAVGSPAQDTPSLRTFFTIVGGLNCPMLRML